MTDNSEDLADVLAKWRATQPKEDKKEKKQRMPRTPKEPKVDPETQEIADKLNDGGISVKELIPWLKKLDDEFTDPQDDDEVDELLEQLQEDMGLTIVSGEGLDSIVKMAEE